MKCSRCNIEAVYEAKYSGEMLCGKHLEESVEKRIKKEIREQVQFQEGGTRIAVAISGGKDSSVTLYALNSIFKDRKDVQISAFTIDEGIKGYRDSGLENSATLCMELGIPHSVISFSDMFETTMDHVVKDKPDVIPCSRCGPMRRQLMNIESSNLNADYVALGINLDDYSQSILMNVARGDVERMARMAPHHSKKDGLTRRILPLRRIPEKEVVLYALLKGIKFDSSWCPYYAKAQRNTFREILETLEERTPGASFSILRFADGIRPALEYAIGPANVNRCKICGQPTSREICTTCSVS
jgi:uncharacterized protein (TIGR00269 family)